MQWKQFLPVTIYESSYSLGNHLHSNGAKNGAEDKEDGKLNAVSFTLHNF